jgi:membrane protein
VTVETRDRGAPQPQPEHEKPRRENSGRTKLGKRDYVAILKRAAKKTQADNLPALAAALAYYAFLAIPAALLVAAGTFSLLAGPEAVNTIVTTLDKVMPAQAVDLIRQSLTNLTKSHASGITILGIGGLLAIWSLGGAMQNVMWALNIAYERKETRGFVRRRLTALRMLFFALLGFGLSFGLLVLGPHLADWIGKATGQEGLVTDLWWAAQWPILILGLMLAFAGIVYLGPNLEHPRFRFLTLGSVVSMLIWLVASGLFSLYVGYFGSFNKTWGTLAGVVVLLVWFWLTGLALLFGAQINAEVDRSREPAKS